LAMCLVAVLVTGSVWALDSQGKNEEPARQAALDPFPVPAGLHPNVAFWRDVYAKWGLGQFALHDMEYMALVYEVVDLPPPVGESVTRAQRDYVDGRLRRLKKRLRHIASSASEPGKLDGQDRKLLRRIIAVAGKGPLRDAAERVRAQRGLRERFRRGLELSRRYEHIFRAVFRDAGLPEDLAYLPHVESSFRNHARSSAGAAGMWQFTASTARRYMRVDRSIDERLDPVVSAQAAANYLHRAYDALGSWPLAVTSYNHGIAGMVRAKEAHGDDFDRIVKHYESPSFGFASQNFYAEFLAARELANEPARHFPEALSFEPRLDHDRVRIRKASSTAAIARRYGLRMDELAACNPAWRDAAARGSAKLAAGTAVWLPAGTLQRSGVAAAGVAIAATAVVPTQRVKEQAPHKKRPAKVHVVARGDTLSIIARQHHTSVRRLRTLNGLRAADAKRLRPGQKLRLPGRSLAAAGGAGARKTHVVRRGDSASRIAARHGVPVSELLATNHLTERSVLQPGQRLGIPAQR